MVMGFPSDLEWRCSVCGRIQPDSKISVCSVDISNRLGLPMGSAEWNIRYCNDNDDCTQGATEMMQAELKVE